MERCRICLDSNNLSNIFEIAEVAQNITAIASVDVFQNDGLPQYICILCKHELDISINFKDKCESTFKMLKQQYSKVQIKENILFNILSEGNKMDSTLPNKARECIMNCMKTSAEQNGEVLKEYNNERNDEADSDAETSISMFKDCYNRNQMEIVESTEDAESVSDIGDQIADDKLIDITEIAIDFSENISMCQKCNFYFANNESLIEHLNRIHPKTMTQCRICLMHFPNSHIMKDHMRQSHNDKNENNDTLFRCKVCNLGFDQQSELNVHLCLHSTQKDFKCDICNNSFKSQKQLDSHIQIVQAIVEYMCEYCNNKFSQDDMYKKHLLHHKNVLHVIGTDKFTGKLQQYLKQDDNKLTCFNCNQVFSNTSDLMMHNKTHKSKKPHVCSICQMSFYKRNGLENHLLEHDDLITCTKDETYVYDDDGDD